MSAGQKWQGQLIPSRRVKSHPLQPEKGSFLESRYWRDRGAASDRTEVAMASREIGIGAERRRVKLRD